MKTLRLASVAAQAEHLRLRRLARRMARRAALLALAGLFISFALVALHIAAFSALTRHLPTDEAALCLAAADLLLALLVLWLAARISQPDATEREARLLRDEALAPIAENLSLGRVILRSQSMLLRLALSVFALLRRRPAPPG